MNRPWMPLYVADYLADTVHLGVAEHGAYLLLIMRYWQDGGLPQDEKLIARYSRMSAAQWAESRDVLAALFEKGWRHKRIDEELARASEIIGKRRAAALHRHHGRSAHAEEVEGASSDAGASPSPPPDSSSLREEGAPARAKPTPRERLEAVLDAEHAAGVLEHRQRLRKPLTERAARLMADNLRQFADPNAAADRMIAKGWLTIEPGWGETPPGWASAGKAPSQADVFRFIGRQATDGAASENSDGVRPALSHLPPAGQGRG